MGHDRYLFEGFEKLAERIRGLEQDAAYVQVWDRTDRKSEENLGRFNLCAADAYPYLDAPEPDYDDDSAFGSDPYGEEEADEDEAPTARNEVSDATFRTYTEAAVVWLQELTANNTLGEEWARYRVRVYGPKGNSVIHTATFVVRNDDADLQCPPQTLMSQLPTLTFEQAETQGAAKGMRALGEYYAQWGHLILGSVGQMQGVNNQMLGRMHHQLTESRGQVDKLVASILDNRFRELEISEERQAGEKADGARHALVREALGQMGDAAKAFLAAKGVDPQMADLLGVLGTSPDLMGALNDPDVRVLMQDPAALGGLAQMLKAAGQQARAAREAMSKPQPGPQPTTS